MSAERLTAMSRAGFRVLGFGVENFSPRVLGEFNKAQIHRHIEPMLSTALSSGVTPFLDLILSSPHSTLEDVGQTLREAYRWLRAGCEIGMYPYVIPFSGSVVAQDPNLLPQTRHAHQRVAGTDIAWQQPVKILPIDPIVADAILRMESSFEAMLGPLERQVAHLPSRLRSLPRNRAVTKRLAEERRRACQSFMCPTAAGPGRSSIWGSAAAPRPRRSRRTSSSTSPNTANLSSKCCPSRTRAERRPKGHVGRWPVIASMRNAAI